MANQEQRWFSLEKIQRIFTLFFVLISTFGVIAATDIFLVHKESELEYDIIGGTNYSQNSVYKALEAEGIDPERVLAPLFTQNIGGEIFFASPYSFPTAIDPSAAAWGTAFQESALFSVEEGKRLSDLPEDAWDYISSKSPGQTDFPSLFPAHLAISLATAEPSKLSRYMNIVKTIEIEAEAYTKIVKIRNNGNAASRAVTIYRPSGTTIVPERGKWEISPTEASIDSVDPGEEAVLVLTSSTQFELPREAINMENNRSEFRESRPLWIALGTAAALTFGVGIADVRKSKKQKIDTAGTGAIPCGEQD